MVERGSSLLVATVFSSWTSELAKRVVHATSACVSLPSVRSRASKLSSRARKSETRRSGANIWYFLDVGCKIHHTLLSYRAAFTGLVRTNGFIQSTDGTTLKEPPNMISANFSDFLSPLSAFGSDLQYEVHATSLTTPAFP